MDLNMPVVRLPREYVTILKSDIYNAKEMIKLFAKEYSQNPGMLRRVQSIFNEYDYAKRIPGIINSLGWKSFRDRLGSVYLYHEIHGQFPQKSNLKLVQDIIDFDNDFAEHTVKSSSRLFMLGLYLNMAETYLQNIDAGNANTLGLSYLPPEVKKVLESSPGKSVYIDWMILAIWHFVSFRGLEWVMSNLKENNGSFRTLYKDLSANEKKVLLGNYLSYGCSTYEYDFFIQEHLV